jgi:hypothetical protein
MTATRQELKQSAEALAAAYHAEVARLTAAGLKSKERYEALKPMKAELDAAWKLHVSAAHKHVKSELNKIIAADAPRLRNEKLARSPWKQAKAGLI